MPDLLQDGNLALDLVLLRQGRDLAEAPLLRKPWDDLDGDMLLGLVVLGLLDLAVDPTAEFREDYILVDEFPTGGGVLVDKGLVCPRAMSVSRVIGPIRAPAGPRWPP